MQERMPAEGDCGGKMSIAKIRNIVKGRSKQEDFKYHIVPMRNYSMKLAEKYKADKEIVELAAWLHDIARLNFEGADHNIIGAGEAEKILIKFGYPKKTIEHVKDCILTHRSDTKSLKPKTLEAKIISTADAMSHFDNIPALFYVALCLRKMRVEDARKWLYNKLMRDWKNKLLLPESKKMMKGKYKAAKILLK